MNAAKITYKATDTLKNPDKSMCAACAAKYAVESARARAGYVDGTQLSRIASSKLSVTNTSGVRGVYYDRRTNKYRVQLKFKGKIIRFGYYAALEDAVVARLKAEEQYFNTFIEEYNKRISDVEDENGTEKIKAEK